MDWLTWLVVWMAFNFTPCLVPNLLKLFWPQWQKKKKKKAEPTMIDFVSNMIMWGEGYLIIAP